uniref:CRAL-TRIO domain-containing protein n=1 Tax=Stomoxys calcitrans TaxID=35570 RepID=A0A1I8NNE2_STOCA
MANILPLSPELQKIAIEELGEVPSRIPEDLAALREWIKLQPHLRVRDDDQLLIQFLRGCKYSLERAKEKIDLFYSLKSKYPQMMNATDVNDPKFREICHLSCFLPFPIPVNGNGSRIVTFRFRYPTSKFNLENVCQPGIALHELWMLTDPYACINGLDYIVDCGPATASHYMQMSPNFCKALVSYLEKSMPFRIKSIYYINTSTATQQMFKMLLPFFSEKLRKRIHIMGNKLEALHKDISPKYLPKDYGGDLATIEEINDALDKTWDTYSQYFKDNVNYGTDESLRPGKPLDIDGLFGVGGSFRKLNVD